MRILLIEDDRRIAQPIAEDFRHQHHSVDVAIDGIAGWEAAQSQAYDLILLDLMLPKLDGITLCQRLRSTGVQAFILMLTARDTTIDKIVGLDAGADDYLVKPFELEELSARIRALSRRSLETKSPILSYEQLQLDPKTCTVTYANVPLMLTPKEYQLLECFLRHPMQVLTKSQLLDRLWEFDKPSGEETIKTHLTNLRRKLKAAGCQGDLIETVYGLGYRLGQARV